MESDQYILKNLFHFFILKILFYLFRPIESDQFNLRILFYLATPIESEQYNVKHSLSYIYTHKIKIIQS